MAIRHTLASCLRAIALASCALLASGAATAQWLWIDSAGNKVFSDTAPPPSTPDKNILRRPGPRAAPPAEAPMPQVSGKDEQLEARKKLADKQAEEADQAKKQAEAERMAKARTDNCERAQRARRTLDSGIRLATTNAKGEREIMDDTARAAEGQRLDGVIRSDCGPLPADRTP